MHLQQTKAGSRQSGGPQYYFHDLPDVIRDHIRRKGACDVVLQTPYGIAATPFRAIGKDHKLDRSGRVVPGRVDHDRVQQVGEGGSIGSAIREWYALPKGRDFERIAVDVSLHSDGHFILSPLQVKMRGKAHDIVLDRPHRPLTCTRAYMAPLWQGQIDRLVGRTREGIRWALSQIRRVVDDHTSSDEIGIKEEDLLRAAGALSMLGVDLSAYVGTGYDCPHSLFRMLNYPCYTCPVEVKKHSKGFRYQILRYEPLPRAVVLCVEHDLRNPPEHVDVIELAALASALHARLGDG